MKIENTGIYSIDQLKKLHSTLKEILLIITEIFDSNDIPYVLIGGTALGARRHKGFIPWDDDIDICILESDIDKIHSVSELFLEHNLIIQNIKTENQTPYYFTKIRLNNTVFDEKIVDGINIHKGIFVDVFPVKYITNSKKKYLLNHYLFTFLNLIYISKKTTYHSNKQKRAYLFFFSFIGLFISNKYLDKLMKNNFNDKEKTWLGYYGVKNFYFKNEDFLNRKLVEFENQKLYQLDNVDDFLKRFFGDTFLELPPLNLQCRLHLQ